ncbi:MAG: hypothetical protein QW594_04345 [Candidatus Woesearchaeota archaeon]
MRYAPQPSQKKGGVKEQSLEKKQKRCVYCGKHFSVFPAILTSLR